MSKTCLGSILAIVLGLGPASAQERVRSSPLAEREEVGSGIRLLEAWIESQMAYRNLPGMSIGIVRDQELVWARGFGYADVEKKLPATPATIYRIASISKTFTSLAVMQLRDQGQLKLDEPASRYLPALALPSGPDAPPITLRHLLTHTAGLPREAPFPYWTDQRFPSREEVLKGLAQQQAVYPPETKWKYSNLGLTLAGEVVAAVSGQPFDAYVHKHILQPLGMNSTSVELPEGQRSRLATGYGRRLPDGGRAVRPFSDVRGIAPAAGFSSTVEDLARYVALQFRDGPAGGSQIVKGSTLREMQRVHWLMPDWKSGRGLGWQIIHREDGDLVGHGGWVAGYQTAVYFRPRDKLAVIALTNADDGLPYPGAPESVVDRAFKWIGPALARTADPTPTPKPNPQWQKYVGKYRSPWADSQVLIYQGQLVLIDPTAADPLSGLSTLVEIAPHTFRIEDGPPFGPHGERVVFELGADGKVSRLKIGENFSYPQQ
jgi:CubicO group peptidase (beta-lactamase class C family)